jgi:MFS family permease
MKALAAQKQSRKIVAAAISGNALEFFDFTSYAFFAVMIGRTFFPSDDPATATLLSLAVFGVGFVTRPAGSIIIGAYADRAGRRPALLLTILLMAIGTVMIAATPGYSTIGIAAPIIIVIARLLQGAALGGELGPATVYLFEAASPSSRGIWTSWQPASQGIATLLAGVVGVGLSYFLTPQALSEWGWRVPFFIGLLIVPIGLALRNSLPETLSPLTKAERESDRLHSAVIFSIFTQIGFGTISIYISTYMTTYAIQTLKLLPETGFYAAIVVGASVFGGSIMGGWLSDFLPRKLVIALPRLLLMILLVPLFKPVIEGQNPRDLIILCAVLPFLAMVSGGATFAAVIDALPPSKRSRGLSTSYALVVAVLGGTAQFIVAWLIGATGDAYVPAYYLMAISLLSLATLPLLVTARGMSLKEAN